MMRNIYFVDTAVYFAHDFPLGSNLRHKSDPGFIFSCSLAVTFAYEQCLLSMGFHPDIWYEAAFFLETHSKQMMDRGVCTHVCLNTVA